MGVHRRQTQVLGKYILDERPRTIVEFGSGASTKFFLDFRKKHSLEYKIVSFDHNEKYAFKVDPVFCQFLSVKIRHLQQCKRTDQLESMFDMKCFDQSFFSDAQHLADDFKAKSCFYKIQEGDLPSDIDLVLLDGPNGSGRSISALHLLGKARSGCLVMIDDCDHYPFLEDFQKVFNCEILVREKCEWIHPLFSYCLLRLHSPID